MLMIHGCIEEWMNSWMDGWIDGCMDGWMDGWMDACNIYLFISKQQYCGFGSII